MMKAVHFGAGNIGRGFIGWLLSRSGYEVCFVVRNERQVALLQSRKQYPVILANEEGDTAIVDNVTAIHASDDALLEKTVAEADLITTAVGAASLQHIAEGIAKGIERRLQENPRPLLIMACENAVSGSSQLKKWVYAHMSAEGRGLADRFISFPDTIIDRIVPSLKHEDPLAVRVEPFYEWIIDRSAIKHDYRAIEGARYVDALEPYIERKLYTVNTGHCSAAYFGYLAGYRTIQEVMQDPRLKRKVQKVLHATGSMLVRKYGLDEEEHRDYIRKTLERFANPGLTDKVARVGRSPIRKLSLHERLVRPALSACDMGFDVSHLVSAMGAALLFDYEKDVEAARLQAVIRKQGIHYAISNILGIPESHLLHPQIAAQFGIYKQRLARARGVEKAARVPG